MKRVLSVAAITGLTILALSVVAGTVVESRGPGADQLPQVSLPTPIDAGVVVAEVTSPSVPQAPSTLAPTTTTVLGSRHEAGRTRSLSAVGGRVTQPTRNTAGPTTTYTPPATTRAPSPTTTERVPHPPAGLHRTATTVPHTWVTTAPTKSDLQDDNHDPMPIRAPRLPTMCSCPRRCAKATTTTRLVRMTAGTATP